MDKQKLIVYGTDSSPTCQSVLLTLKALAISNYELRIVNPKRGENLNSEYVNKNPAHTIPTLEDNGFFIGDSHAIMAYLVDKYGKTDQLYPKDLQKRALVNQLMHFENGALFVACVKQSLQPIFARQTTAIPAEKYAAIEQGYTMLEAFFGDNPYVAGQHMTIADFCCFTSVACMQVITTISEERHPKLYAWFQRMRALPYMEEVTLTDGAIAVQKFLNKQLSKL